MRHYSERSAILLLSSPIISCHPREGGEPVIKFTKIMYKYYYVYILASKRNGTLYIGMTNNLVRRVWEHKNKIFKGFTNKYNVNKLVYYEIFENVNEAIGYEKRIKKWNRLWKLRIIEEKNSTREDLSEKISIV